MKNDELKDVILEQLLLRTRLTRQEFLELHPCRPASMLHAINELKNDGLVIEPDRAGAKTGRRSPALVLDPAFGAFAGLELQPQRLLGVLLDCAGNTLARAALEFPAGITAQAIPGTRAAASAQAARSPLTMTKGTPYSARSASRDVVPRGA